MHGSPDEKEVWGEVVEVAQASMVEQDAVSSVCKTLEVHVFQPEMAE